MNNNHHKRPVIVFDFGGVLLDWSAYHLYGKYFGGDHVAIDSFLEEIGFAEWNYQQDKGRPFTDAVAEMSARFPQYVQLIRAYDENWEDSMGGAIQPTVEVLYALKQAGYRLYALSNWSEEKFRLVRPKYEFLDWFEDIVISGELKLAKPDPRIYTTFLERTGLPAGDCLYIDDTLRNIEVASQLGFQTILFESGDQLAQELQLRGLLIPGAVESLTGKVLK